MKNNKTPGTDGIPADFLKVILFNCDIVDPIQIQRGCRQGDPISSCLLY